MIDDKVYRKWLISILLVGGGGMMCTMTIQEASVMVFLIGFIVMFLMVALGDDEVEEEGEG